MQNFTESLPERLRALYGIAAPEKIPLHAPSFYGNERKYILDTLDSTYVSSVGEYVGRFEIALQQCTGARFAVACSSGTDALQVALHLAGVQRGDLVLTQTLSFVATANAIMHNGAEPVFLDVDYDTMGLSPTALSQFLHNECLQQDSRILHKASGRRIAACVPMHTFGLPCRIAEIIQCCTEFGIPVVEDAAEALGSFMQNRGCGTWGKSGILSFNGNKTCTTGGGGAILTDDGKFAETAKHLTTAAKIPHPWEYRHDAVAWNYRMPNLNAALGCAQLEHLEIYLTKKRKIAAMYSTFFADSPWHFVQEIPESRSNYWLCAVLAENRTQRDTFLQCAYENGIQCRPLFEPLHTLPMYRHCFHDDLQVSTELVARCINLPSSPSLLDHE